jgi:prepilin-type processing-associated H-X9-DG protein
MCVILVIAIVVGLLMPVIRTARQAANQVVCANNLRQWAFAVNLYAQENQGWLPRRAQGKMPTVTINLYDDWFNELPPLIKQMPYEDMVTAGKVPQLDSRSVWICPEAQGVVASGAYLFCYGMNMALSVRVAPLPDRMNGVGPVSSMVFMADGPAGYCSTVPFISTASNPAPFNPVPRHNGKVNIAFLDGHVSAYGSNYLGINTAGDPVHPDACDRPDVRWYWYVPGPLAPWGGP